MTVMEEAYYFNLISGGKLAKDHLSICSKYLGKPEKNRGREWEQKAQTKYIEKSSSLKSCSDAACELLIKSEYHSN